MSKELSAFCSVHFGLGDMGDMGHMGDMGDMVDKGDMVT